MVGRAPAVSPARASATGNSVQVPSVLSGIEARVRAALGKANEGLSPTMDAAEHDQSASETLHALRIASTELEVITSSLRAAQSTVEERRELQLRPVGGLSNSPLQRLYFGTEEEGSESSSEQERAAIDLCVRTMEALPRSVDLEGEHCHFASSGG